VFPNLPDDVFAQLVIEAGYAYIRAHPFASCAADGETISVTSEELRQALTKGDNLPAPVSVDAGFADPSFPTTDEIIEYAKKYDGGAEESNPPVITDADFQDPCFPTTDEIIAACLKYVGDGDWPEDDWIPLSDFEINLWLDEEDEPVITYYPSQGGETDTSIGVRVIPNQKR